MPIRVSREGLEITFSTFMIYLGLKKQYDYAHHQVLFSGDYRKNMDQLFREYRLPEDPSVYLQNPWKTDASLAPPGKSTLYILVPVPNNRSAISWDRVKEGFREQILDLVEKRGGYKNLRKAIEVERIFTPWDWEEEMDLYNGAAFSLSHNMSQMLYYRPHNRNQDVKNLYLVGGSTHPGSGLPTILLSAVITADLVGLIPND